MEASPISTSLYFVLASSDNCIGLHVVIMGILTHAFTFSLFLFSENLKVPCSILVLFLNFKVAWKLGIGRNLGSRVVWFLPLSFKWAGVGSWNFPPENTGDYRASFLRYWTCAWGGHCSFPWGFDTYPHRICMTNGEWMQSIFLFFSLNILGYF